MNCPMHIAIYQSETHSYRELPKRYAEFGTVYRWEKSGELNGLTRVRGFTQDDAHIFCTQEQLKSEIVACLKLVKKVFDTLGMNHWQARLGLRETDNSKYIGSQKQWAEAEIALKEAAQEIAIPFNEVIGEAAFYGPKIDFVVKDYLEREWQLGTVQVDYNLAERFGLSYIGKDNKSHSPVIIHRAPLGSMERFIGLLIEQFEGDFPTWLAPEQVRILPLNDHLLPYAKEIEKELQTAGIRANVDKQAQKLGAKIRKAELEKIPHLIVVGEKEAEERTISVRSRTQKSLEGKHAIEDFIRILKEEIEKKKLPERPK